MQQAESAANSFNSVLADLTSIREYHSKSLYNACFNGDENKVRQILVGARADIDYTTQNTGATAAYIAAYKGHVNCLSLLSQHEADLNKQANDGFAPIHVACSKGRVDCTALLLSKVDVNSASSKRKATPAFLACLFGHEFMLQLLILHNAGNTPITFMWYKPIPSPPYYTLMQHWTNAMIKVSLQLTLRLIKDM